MNTEIYLRRRNKIVVTIPTSSHTLPDVYLVALQKNIEGLGYTLSSEVLHAIKQLDEAQIDLLYRDLTEALIKLVGAHVRYEPMYPNFPQQVAEAPDIELHINSLIHYYGDSVDVDLRILPDYKKQPRSKFTDKLKLKTIALGNTDDFNSIFTNLVQSKVAMSEVDKQDIEWFIKSFGDSIAPLLPSEIPNKENLAIVSGYFLKHATMPVDTITRYFKTATDVLRLMTALSEGDVSLAANTKFKNISRSERRMLLELLENCGSLTEDMLRYKEQWKRVGERLHPTEYAIKFPKTAKAFEILRDDMPFETFNGKLEKHIQTHEVSSALMLLKTRPGELARKLDLLLRTSDDHHEEVLQTFSKVASKISSTVLLQLAAHFKERNHQKTIRVFFPKGNVGKAQAVDNKLPKIKEESRQEVIAICKEALKSKYSMLASLGKVYIDRELKHFTVPFATRSASKALRTIGRGSRLKLPPGNTVRFFIWWKDGLQRTDLDLSALALDEHSQFKMQITYYNLRELGGYHSGDITSAPDGASEFIDMEVDKMLAAGVRYILMSVNSYTRQPFYELPECFAGFMIRRSPQSGEIYEPKTVENKIDLTANTKICLPFIIDLKNRTVIWTDLAVSNSPSHANNVINNMSTLTIMNEAMLSLVKPNLYDLFTLHAEARGEIVKSIEEADTIFSTKKGITPFDSDKIVGEYL
jgi:hypothetical protein